MTGNVRDVIVAVKNSSRSTAPDAFSAWFLLLNCPNGGLDTELYETRMAVGAKVQCGVEWVPECS
jgi:hypothetical protein